MSGGTTDRLAGADPPRRRLGRACGSLVAGLGVSGFAAADALRRARGARSPSVDAPTATDAIARAGARSSTSSASTCGSAPEHVVTAARGHRARRHLARAGAPTSRCSRRPPRPASRSGARSSWPGGCGPREGAAPWLTVTGTNGKTTTVQMLAVDPAGRRAARAARRQRRHPAARGGAATPSRTTCSPSSCPASSCTGRTRWPRWPSAVPQRRPRPPRLARLARRVRRRQGPGLRRTPRSPASTTSQDTAHRAAGRGGRRAWRAAGPIGFTLGIPGPSELGVVDDVLADRAFVEQRRTAAAELGTLADLQRRRADARRRTTSPTPWPPPPWPARYGVAAGGRPRRAARLRARPAPHRRGRRRSTASRYVDDSKATNPHAAARLAGRLRARRVGRRRPAQGRRRRRPGRQAPPTGCAASC